METPCNAEKEVARDGVVPSLGTSLCIQRAHNVAALGEEVESRELQRQALVAQQALLNRHIPYPLIGVHRLVFVSVPRIERQV